MNGRVREHVAQFNKREGYGTSDADIIETIQEADELYREEIRQRRWWNEYLYVVDVDGMLVGYEYAETTGDISATEAGYEFDPSAIHEMVATEKTITVYTRAPV